MYSQGVTEGLSQLLNRLYSKAKAATLLAAFFAPIV